VGSDTEEAGRLVNLARSLLAKGGMLQSTGAGEAISSGKLEQAVTRHVEQNAALYGLPPEYTAKAAAAEVVKNAERAIENVSGGAPLHRLTDLEYASLEAIVEVTGRPAMRFDKGRLQMPPSDLGENDRWRVLVATGRKKFDCVSAGVGRIGLAGGSDLRGTGWRTGMDLVVTNRHVARELAKNPEGSAADWKLDEARNPRIDFTVTDNVTAPQSYAISEIAYCAAEDDVDLAVLRLTPGETAFPATLKLDWDPEAVGRELPGTSGAEPRFQGEEIYVVGHPYRARGSGIIAVVFGVADGSKRCSPGKVVGIDRARPVLEHDCSTLGGSSGSCVVTVGAHAAIGLHMGGVEVDAASGKGTANLALAFSRLGGHRAEAILRTGTV
jgi:hypothetical protein